MDISKVVNAKTATEAVEAAIDILKTDDARAALGDPEFVEVTRQAIFDTDERRDYWVKQILDSVPVYLRLLVYQLLPAHCQV